MRIVVINHVTLDGVMQSPGRPDEDTRGGFTHGGWAAPRSTDETVARAWGERLSASSGYLFGRRTYEGVLGYWNTQDSPFREALNNAPKYVASTTLTTPLPWPNSTLLTGGLGEAVATLKQTPGNDLHIMGSGNLLQSLAALHLIDEYVLTIHPLTLGTGHRLFPETFTPTTFDTDPPTPTPSGALIATYRPHPDAQQTPTP